MNAKIKNEIDVYFCKILLHIIFKNGLGTRH